MQIFTMNDRHMVVAESPEQARKFYDVKMLKEGRRFAVAAEPLTEEDMDIPAILDPTGSQTLTFREALQLRLEAGDQPPFLFANTGEEQR